MTLPQHSVQKKWFDFVLKTNIYLNVTAVINFTLHFLT